MTTIKLHEPKNNDQQDTVKSIIEEIQELTFTPCEISGNDVQVFAGLLTDKLERLIKALGLNDVSLSAESKIEQSDSTLKAQLQDLFVLNDSMFYNDDKDGTPRFTDGREITAKDLADMNINALSNIAEFIGFELEE